MKLNSLMHFAIDRMTAISKPKLFVVAFVVCVGLIIGIKKLGSKKHPNTELLPSDTAVYQDIAATAIDASQSGTVATANVTDVGVADTTAASSPTNGEVNTSPSTQDKGNKATQNDAAKDAAKTKTIDQLAPEELKRKDSKLDSKLHDTKENQTNKAKAIDDIIDNNAKQNAKQSPSPAISKYRFAQLGAFGSKESAKRLIQKVKKSNKQKDVKIMLEKKLVKKQVLFVVQAGPFKTSDDAKRFCQKLKSLSGSQQCIVSK